MYDKGENVVSIALRKADQQQLSDAPFSELERATVSAICNRVARILGLLDRSGLQRDLAIVQQWCPINLEALAQAQENVFVEELLSILEATDRVSGTLNGSFRSRFTLQQRQLTQA